MFAFPRLLPVTKNLIIINFIVWLAMLILPRRLGVDFEAVGGLHYVTASDFNPVQLITYMFMHDTSSFAHLFFNMFTLWMFGSTIESVLGRSRYLFFYITVGVGAALFQELVWALIWEGKFVDFLSSSTGYTKEMVRMAIQEGEVPESLIKTYLNKSMVTIGASGAIYGILLAYGMIFPNRRLYLMFMPVPIKAKWMVIGYGVIEILLGVSSNDGVAHFAHLGGMLFGFLLIWWWKKKGVIYGDWF